MRVIRSPIRLRSEVERYKRARKTIGFVPTMGALHEGHLSLIRRARKECDRVVVSIFVNPLQFGPREDYKRYPRTLSQDKKLLKKEKVDLLFFPSLKTMYPDLFSTSVSVKGLTDSLCGPFRPGHFRGVTTVCSKLFHLVRPDTVYFGQKDFQQAKIIERMLQDLDFGIRFRMLPTLREKDGLAMSSRNRYLSKREREKASSIFRSLTLGKEMIREGEKGVTKIVSRMKSFLRKSGLRVDYVSLVDPETLETRSEVRLPLVLAVAAWAGKTRLIDNLLVGK